MPTFLMKDNVFFKALADEFENHPYKERFLEEVQDHVEDLAKDQNLPKKSITTPFLEKLFGEPVEIKKIFIDIVDPWRNIFFISEAFIVGIPLAIAGVVFYNTVKAIILEDNVIDIFSIGSLFIIGLMWFLGYKIAFNLLSEIKYLGNFKDRAWTFFVTAPSNIIFFIMAYSDRGNLYPLDHLWLVGGWLFIQIFIIFFTHRAHKRDRRNVQQRIKNWNVLFFLPNIFLFIVLIFFDFNHYSGSTLKKALPLFVLMNGLILLSYLFFTKKKKTIKLPKIMGNLFLLGGIFFIILRVVLTHINFGPWVENPWLLIPFFPIFLMDLLAEMTWVFGRSSSALKLYLPLGIFAFVILQSIYVTIRRKKFLNDRLLVIIYSLSLLFINPNAFVAPVDFEAESLKISALIEKEDLSVFYPYVKYMNLDKDNLFKPNLNITPSRDYLFDYEIFTHTGLSGEDYFVIHNSINESYFIKITQLDDDFQSKNYNELIKKDILSESKIDDIISELEGVNPFSDELNELAKEISKKPHLNPGDFTFSPDKKWLLLILPESGLGSDAVHLIKIDDFYE